jgi:hypothetical protein
MAARAAKYTPRWPCQEARRKPRRFLRLLHTALHTLAKAKEPPRTVPLLRKFRSNPYPSRRQRSLRAAAKFHRFESAAGEYQRLQRAHARVHQP